MIKNPLYDKYGTMYGPEWITNLYPPVLSNPASNIGSFCDYKTLLCCSGIGGSCLIAGIHQLATMQSTNYVANAIIGSLLIASSYCCSCYAIKTCFHSSDEQGPFECVKNCNATNVACVALGLLTAALGFFTLSSINPTDINAVYNNGAYGVIGPLLITASLVCCFRNFIFSYKSENSSERTPLRSAEQKV